jgi:excisionase family DNA binding protein
MRKEKQPSTDQGFLLSVAEVAVRLGVCRQTVYNLIYREGLPTIQMGKVRRIDPESLRLWIKEREQ